MVQSQDREMTCQWNDFRSHVEHQRTRQRPVGPLRRKATPSVTMILNSTWTIELNRRQLHLTKIMKMKPSLVIALNLLLAAASTFAEEKKPDPKFHIYLCFGQSNMEAGARPDPQDKGELDPRFQMLAAVDMPRLNRTQ